jgi:hypothetical protein
VTSTATYLHSLGSRAQRVLIGQIYYDDASRRHLDDNYCPLANPVLGKFFEADVIRAAIASRWHAGANLVGIFSWRFAEKIPLAGADVIARLAAAPEHDVYSFFGALEPGQIWQLAEAKHPGILAAGTLLFTRLGVEVDLPSVVAPPIYQHHFVARSDVYERFVETHLGPALDAMSDPADTRLQRALLADSGYRNPRHSPEDLEQLYGVPYLPLHPFVAERLFSTWLALTPAVTTHALWNGRFVAEADVRHEPELRGGSA